MSLTITAELTESDLSRLLDELLPLTLSFGGEGEEAGRRWIWLEKPHHVDFVAGVGLRLKTSGKLQWTAVGVALPVTLNEVELLLRPQLASDEQGPKLVFRPVVEAADLRLMPAFVDNAVADRINAALAEEGNMLAWHIGKALSHTVELPANMSPVDLFTIAAGEAHLEVKDQAVVLKVALNMSFHRGRPVAPPET